MNKYVQTYFITNNDMDIEYRLKRTAIPMFFQDCFAQYMTTKYLAAFDIIKDNIIWIISEYNIDFIKQMPFWSEKIDVEIWISEITKIKIYADFKIYHNNEIIAQGDSCWFNLDATTKKPLSTKMVTDKLTSFDNLMINNHKKNIYPAIKTRVSEYKHKINITDLDFNHHVNNKSYLAIAEYTASPEFLAQNELKSISIKYLKESFLEDTLICELYKTENEKDNTEVCNIYSKWTEKTFKELIFDYNLQIRSWKNQKIIFYF